MKILVVTNLYAPESRGGAENIAKLTSEEMVRQGHEVLVYTTTGSEAREGVVEGVRVRRYVPKLPYHILEDSKQPLWKRLLWHLKDVNPLGTGRKEMGKVIEDLAPSLIISHNLRGIGMGVVRSIRKSGVRWIHIVHDVQLLVPSGQYWFDHTPIWQRRVVTWPYRHWMNALMGSPDLVVGPTNFILDEHKKAGLFKKSEFRVIENPVDIEVEQREEREVGEVLMLLFVGQLSRGKGVHVLLDALMTMEDRRASLRIIGDGPERVSLMDQALKLPDTIDVEFVGKVPHKEVIEEMKKADALVLPSVILENCPGVILEARAVGLPIIASDIGGIPELIDESGLFEVGDPRHLTGRIAGLSNSETNNSTVALSVTKYMASLLR